MRYILFGICCLALATNMSANDSTKVCRDIFQDMPNVVVHQDSTVAQLLTDKIYGTSEVVEIDGYRVQIYSSNRQQSAKAEALQLEKTMREKLSISVYVLYMPPFWKVRLGDFRNYEEANLFKTQIIEQFPTMQGDTYIVRDKIQVMK
ncbi:MAG: SPOR domain-containing protein [Paludibacteraceae bacterium]